MLDLSRQKFRPAHHYASHPFWNGTIHAIPFSTEAADASRTRQART
jgi:hypothetical protein